MAAAGPAGGGVASLWTPGRSTDALGRVGGGNPPADTARSGLPVSAGPIGDLVDRVRARISGSAVLDPGRRGVAALAAVALIACGVAGWSAWRARPRTEPVAAVAVAAGPSTAGPAAASTGPAEVVVAVGGTVRRPGLVRLRPGSRVADAVRAAGGILPGSDLGALNLARKVTDGELVMVGSAAAAEPATGSPAGTLVNLNTATAADLDALPGVGPVLAQRIVDFRREHGSFASVDQLREVTGIGDAKLEQLRDRVTV